MRRKQKPTSSGRPEVRVEAVAVKTTKLIDLTVGETFRSSSVKNAIVRLRQTVDTTDAELEAMRQGLTNLGAVAIRVLPRPRRAVLPRQEERPKVEKKSAREVVLALVEESNGKDKEQLRAYAEKVLGKVGL